MTNNANHSPRNTRSINDQEVTMFQLDGHTLTAATMAASFVIEGDILVSPFGTPNPSPVADVDMETPFIARVTFADGTACRRTAPITEATELQLTVLRNVPSVDDYDLLRDAR